MGFFKYWLMRRLKKISLSTGEIMASLADLNAKVDELRETFETEHQQIRDAIEGLNVQVAALQGLVVDGGTEAERQAVLDKIESIRDDLANVVPDVPLPPPAPPV